MIISIIVAMDRSRGIAKDNRIPWHLSSDLKMFRSLTMGHHIVMGRVTYESIGRSLPGRTSIVVTRNLDYQIEDGFVTHSLQDALKLAEERGEIETYIIGGSQLYRQSIKLADVIHLTIVDTDAECDLFFPELNMEEWQETEYRQFNPDENNQFAFSYHKLQRTLT